MSVQALVLTFIAVSCNKEVTLRGGASSSNPTTKSEAPQASDDSSSVHTVGGGRIHNAENPIVGISVVASGKYPNGSVVLSPIFKNSAIPDGVSEANWKIEYLFPSGSSLNCDAVNRNDFSLKCGLPEFSVVADVSIVAGSRLLAKDRLVIGAHPGLLSQETIQAKGKAPRVFGVALSSLSSSGRDCRDWSASSSSLQCGMTASSEFCRSGDLKYSGGAMLEHDGQSANPAASIACLDRNSYYLRVSTAEFQSCLSTLSWNATTSPMSCQNKATNLCSEVFGSRYFGLVQSLDSQGLNFLCSQGVTPNESGVVAANTINATGAQCTSAPEGDYKWINCSAGVSRYCQNNNFVSGSFRSVGDTVALDCF